MGIRSLLRVVGFWPSHQI